MLSRCIRKAFGKRFKSLRDLQEYVELERNELIPQDVKEEIYLTKELIDNMVADGKGNILIYDNQFKKPLNILSRCIALFIVLTVIAVYFRRRNIKSPLYILTPFIFLYPIVVLVSYYGNARVIRTMYMNKSCTELYWNELFNLNYNSCQISKLNPNNFEEIIKKNELMGFSNIADENRLFTMLKFNNPYLLNEAVLRSIMMGYTYDFNSEFYEKLDNHQKQLIN